MADYDNIVQGGAAISIGGDLGYIKDGVALAVASEMMYHTVEGVHSHVGARNPQQNYEVITTLAEITLANLKLVWDWQESTSGSDPILLEFGVGNFKPTEVAVSIYAYVPGGNLYTRTITLDRAVAVPGGEIKTSDATGTTLPATWHGLYNATNSRVGVVSDAQS